MNTRKCKENVKYIVVHHAYIPQSYSDDTCKRILSEEAKKLYGSAFGGLYNYTVLPSGECVQLVPPGYYAPHCGYNYGEDSKITNDNSIGISVCAKMDTETTLRPAILASLINEVVWLAGQYNIPAENIVKHSDVVATNCPGTHFPWSQFMKEVNNKMKSYPDVDTSRWSYSALKRAEENGILTGDTDGKMHPGDPVTKEQVAVMLFRFKEKFLK